jgi:hypothetical protein
MRKTKGGVFGRREDKADASPSDGQTPLSIQHEGDTPKKALGQISGNSCRCDLMPED